MDRGPSSKLAYEIGRQSLASLNDPFSTPVLSRSRSAIGLSTAREHEANSTVPVARYYHSRRIIRDENARPPKIKRQPGEKWLWIIPLMGFLIGLAVVGVMIWRSMGASSYQYCPVLSEDFSSGVLNPKVWTTEIEVGGFGNLQFEQTTSDAANLFIRDSQLHIKPTLQDETLIHTNTIINLTETGTCTSTVWSNCITSTNTTNGTIVQPVKSARINTKLGASIRYGRVEVLAKLPQGDWLWPAIWMMPVEETYGAWPASGEIDIVESRGNNHTYPGGNDVMSSSLHWGPDPLHDGYRFTSWGQEALHSEFGDNFHLFGLEWSEKYIFTYIDTTLLQVFYYTFDKPLWPQGGFPASTSNGSRITDPWSQTGRPSTPFDQNFYLILNVAVGGRNGWFKDGVGAKPWVDTSATAKRDFWAARDQWYPTWQQSGEMVVKTVKMWQQC